MGSACSAEPIRNNLHRASSDSDGHFDDHNDRPYTTIRRASSTSGGGTSAGSRENSGTTCHTTCSEGVSLTITSRGSASDNSASDLQQRHVELRLNQCSGDESALAFLHLSGQSTYQKQKKKGELKRKKSVDQQHVARSEYGSEETTDIDGASDSSVATPLSDHHRSANNSRKASVALVSNKEEGKEVAKAESHEEEEEDEEEEVSPLVASVSATRLGPLLYRNKLNDPKPSPAALPSGATISPKGGDEEDARSRGDDHDHRLPTPSVMPCVASAPTSPKSGPTGSSPYLPPRGPQTTTSSSPRHCHFQGLHKKSASKKSLFQIHGSFSVDTNPFLGSDSSVGAVVSAAARRHKRCNNSVSVSYADDGPHGGSNSLSASGRGGCPPPNEPSLTHCPGTESHDEGDTTHRLTPLSLLGDDYHLSSPQDFDPLCLSGKRVGVGSVFGSNTSNNSYILGDFNHYASSSGGAGGNHHSSTYYPVGGPVALLKITSGMAGGSSSSSVDRHVVVPGVGTSPAIRGEREKRQQQQTTKKGAVNDSSQEEEEEEVVDSSLHHDGAAIGATMPSKPPPCDANENTATFLPSFATTNSSAPGVSEDKRGSLVSTLESAA